LGSASVAQPGKDLFAALAVGLTIGLTVAFVFGGQACLSHYALRMVLWRIGAMPLDTVRFLDYASERIFLRKVGGGYIFVHRLLQDYLAAQENPPREGRACGSQPE
jgi:hypothetical protein